MGIEFGFDKAKRYKDTTIQELRRIETYHNWKTWNSKAYTLEEYMEMYGESGPLPSQDKIDFYMNEYKKNKGDMTDNIGFICGWDNTYIAEAVIEKLHSVSNDYYGEYDGVTPEVIDELKNWVDEELKKHELTPVYIREGIAIDENNKETVVNLSRLVVENEDGDDFLFKINSYTRVFIPGEEFDGYKGNSLENFRKILDKVSDVDQNEYIVWFFVS